MTERRKMTVTFEVTDAQALTLEAMFDYWNRLCSVGMSRTVSFMVDGDGNFKPMCRVEYPDGRPTTRMTLEEVELLAFEGGNDTVERHHFDFDSVAWAMHDEPKDPFVNSSTLHSRYLRNVKPPEKRALIEEHLGFMERKRGRHSAEIHATRLLLDELDALPVEAIPTFKLMVLAKRVLNLYYIDAFHKDPT